MVAAGSGRTASLGAATYRFDDFGSNLLGVYLPAGTGLVGAGVEKTQLEMTPHSSSKSGSVPTIPWTTNQLYLLSTSGTPHLSGFTLQGTDQGHLYNGLRVGQATDARVSDIKVAAIPGNDHMPPGETFAINDWRTTGSRYDRIEVDGGGIGASGFATNSSKNVVLSDSYLHDNNGGGAVFWQTQNITLNDVVSVDNGVAFNFERTSGTVDINRPTISGNKGQDIYVASDQGSAKVTIRDPKITPGTKLRIHVPYRYMGTTNLQRQSDVRVLVNGVDKTDSLVHWMYG